jgi:hypothetical protein
VCRLKYVGTASRGTTWYRCGGQVNQRGKFEGRCIGKSVKAEHIEPVVWADIVAWLRDPGTLLEELEAEANNDAAAAIVEASRATLEAALDSLHVRRQRRLDQHERGLINDAELDAALSEIASERSEIDARLGDLSGGEANRSPLRADLVGELRARLDAGLTEKERQEVVRLLVASVHVSTERDEGGAKTAQAVIEYRFPPHAVVANCTAPSASSGLEDGLCSSDFLHGCPCGYYGDSKRSCSCPEATVSRYQRRVSGPLLDRFDLFVDVPRVEFEELTGTPTGERSATVRDRVIEARSRQAERLSATPYVTNSEMGPLEVRRFCQEPLAPEAHPLLAAATERLGLSARAFHRVLKVARTVADLGGSERIETAHLAEAIQYRRRGAD